MQNTMAARDKSSNRYDHSSGRSTMGFKSVTNNSANLRANLQPANRVVRLRPVHGYSVTKHDDSAAILEKPCGDKEAKTTTAKKFVTVRWEHP
jgi:copper oxidase (laccase) domain-containing protein